MARKYTLSGQWYKYVQIYNSLPKRNWTPFSCYFNFTDKLCNICNINASLTLRHTSTSTKPEKEYQCDQCTCIINLWLLCKVEIRVDLQIFQKRLCKQRSVFLLLCSWYIVGCGFFFVYVAGLIAVTFIKKQEEQLDKSTVYINSPAFIVFYGFPDQSNPRVWEVEERNPLMGLEKTFF